jgi:ABC-2 type transport system permease protein
MNLSREINALFTIAFRDFTKLIRDRFRLISSLIFPLIFIGVLGRGQQSALGGELGYNLLTFTFTGVFAQTLFQSTASGISFLIQDRESDFSQEIFVSPISRYTIVLGKILGETLVSYVQVIGVVIFGVLFGAQVTPIQILLMFPAGLIAALFGGAFGMLILANMNNIRSAQQIFPFVIFPQIFLAGIFFPIKNLDPIMKGLSLAAPMTYAVDFVRGIFYWGTPEYNDVVLFNPWINLAIISVLFVVMITIGTYMFVKNERNR